MNFLEAIRSGKSFRRKGSSTGWLTYLDKEQRITFDDGVIYNIYYTTNWDSVMFCDDWELKEEEISITIDQLSNALHACPFGIEFLTSEGHKLRVQHLWNSLKGPPK